MPSQRGSAIYRYNAVSAIWRSVVAVDNEDDPADPDSGTSFPDKSAVCASGADVVAAATFA